MNGNLSKSIIVVKVIFILLIATVIIINITIRTTIQTQGREKTKTSSGPQNDFGNFIPICMNRVLVIAILLSDFLQLVVKFVGEDG